MADGTPVTSFKESSPVGWRQFLLFERELDVRRSLWANLTARNTLRLSELLPEYRQIRGRSEIFWGMCVLLCIGLALTCDSVWRRQVVGDEAGIGIACIIGSVLGILTNLRRKVTCVFYSKDGEEAFWLCAVRDEEAMVAFCEAVSKMIKSQTKKIGQR